MKSFAAAVISISLLVAAPLAMADDIKTERVQFEQGTSGAKIKGTITGYETMHYMIGAKAGQLMDVKLVTKSTSTYFNIFAPGKIPGQAEAMFIGDTGGDHFNGKLPESGDYLIQVYLYRSAARKGKKASFDLNVEIATESSASRSRAMGRRISAASQRWVARRGTRGCGRDDGGWRAVQTPPDASGWTGWTRLLLCRCGKNYQARACTIWMY